MKPTSARTRTILLLLGVILGVALVLIRSAWRDEQKGAVFSCVSSIAAALTHAEKAVDVSSHWRLLHDGELADLLGSRPGFDCARTSRPFADVWNNALQAAVRRHSSGGLEFRVWSVGPDGRSNTPDDIVVPYGEKVPIQ